MSEKPPRVDVPAASEKPSEAKPSASEKPSEAKPSASEKPPEAKAAPSEKPAAKATSERPKAEKPKQSSAPAKAATPSNAPSQTRSAILPLGIATAVIAGLLLWLGSGNDEPLPMEPETATQAPADTPGAPELHAVNQPKAEQPKAEEPPTTEAAAPAASAEATAEPAASASTEGEAAPAPSAEPAPPASAAEAAEAASAVPAAPAAPEPATSAAADPTPAPADSSEPIPSDEGLLEGPVTQVFMAPDCAELYRKGKRIGRSGVRVRVPEGKRRFYEVVCPGHNTRKLTIDGSRKEVSIGLRPIKR
jgi:hypothetical protein